MNSRYWFFLLFLLASSCGINSEDSKEANPNDDSKKNGAYYWWVDKNGKGEWIEKDEDGNWMPSDGTLTDYWENGNLKRTTEFKDGKTHGMLKSYDKGGDLLLDAYFTKARVDSIFNMYYRNGQKQIEMTLDKEGMSTITTFNMNGKKEWYATVLLSEHLMIKESLFHPNGQIKLLYQNDSIKCWNNKGVLLNEDDSVKGLSSLFKLDMVKEMIRELANGEDIIRPKINYGCVSGDCINGKGRYTYAVGMSYVGFFREGAEHGEGSYLDHNENLYCSGNYKQGLMIGDGYFEDEGVIYEGGLLYGIPHGYGEMEYKDGSAYKGNFVKGEVYDAHGEYTYTDGSIFYGNIVKDFFHGPGKIVFPEGDSVVGIFRNDDLYGNATYYGVDGEIERRNYAADGYTVIED